ncbi:ABC transporter permease [Zunongwangia atlantica]|uniref:ABC transporter permease n=1 Tax=Zunongwangia atlantica 22II14-10F7 TaxID=1185767 RepID=A0A1Y1T174_9FLAO|nr:ABC transporter permease [Zunongwangia atlantica]ORL44552.1 hypothetical protein IIF7_14973 [Zunongwangia atlantica 22II14-10F7]
MFDLERWQEIFETISKNKLRTFLTGLSVASGIFILVILLGIGEGMKNGIEREFQGDAANAIFVYPGVTTKEYKGLNPGRRIQLKNDDFEYTSAENKSELEFKSAVFRIFGGMVTFENESGSYRVEGVYPDYQFLENSSMVSGRFLNNRDVEESTKIVVLGNRVKMDLFKDSNDVLGKYVEISGIKFKVVGVYTDPGGEREESRVFVPITTAQKVFSGGNDINSLSYTLKAKETYEEALAASNNFTSKLETYLKGKHTIAPSDNSAIYINNMLENTKRFYDLIGMIKMFFWGVGICTIIAGVVGVSNIMLIIVKERTREIGVRKALGAQPLSIIGMVLHESIFVTSFAGLTGLIMGLVLLDFVGPMIQTDFIYNPTVNFNVALSTVVILIVAGAVAGFFPAYRAARIKPIIALRDE